MLVFIFDTTETYATPTFRGAKWEKIGRFLKNKQNRGIIPQIVFEETLNHIREQFADFTHQYKEAVRKLSDLSGGSGYAGVLQRSTKHGNGGEFWLPATEADIRRRLQELGISVADYSECSLQSIVARALQRKKPFDSKGQRGFRDAILWDTLIRVLSQSNDHVNLITQNSNDFVLKGELVPDLLAELAGLGHSGRVTVYNGLDPFITAVVDPTLERATQAIEAIRSDSYAPLEPIGFIKDHLGQIQDIAATALAKGRFRLESKYGHDIVGATLASQLTPLNVTHADAYHTDGAMLAVTLNFEAEAVLDAQMLMELGEEGIAPWHDPISVKSIFSFSSSLLVDETSQTIVESAFACQGISITRDPSPSFITLPPS